jgi:hypothetical protein
MAVVKNIASLCALSLLISVTSPSRSESAPAEPTLWEHNGSVVFLVAKGSSRSFYYKEPRPDMIQAGARSGSLLFQGDTHEANTLEPLLFSTAAAGNFLIQ